MITLTVAELINLIQFAGFTLDPAQLAETDNDERATQITIDPCPKLGIHDDDHQPRHYYHIAYFTEYPEEGALGLGKEIQP